MRKVFSVALMAAMVCLVGMTKDASATITVTLEWGACAGGTGSCRRSRRPDDLRQPRRRPDAATRHLHEPRSGGGLRVPQLLAELRHLPRQRAEPRADGRRRVGRHRREPGSRQQLLLLRAVDRRLHAGFDGARMRDASTRSRAPRWRAFCRPTASRTASGPTRRRRLLGIALVRRSSPSMRRAVDGADVFSGAFNLPGIIDTFVDGNSVLIPTAR